MANEQTANAGANAGTSADAGAPASAGTALTAESIAKLVADGVAAATRELTAKIAALEAQVKPAAEAKAAASEKTDADVKPAAVTADEVARIVAEGIAADHKARETSSAERQARDAARAKVVAARLGGVPASLLATLPDTANEAELTAAADKLRADLESVPGVKLPDVGGTAKDGGQTPASQAGNDGHFLKMPG